MVLEGDLGVWSFLVKLEIMARFAKAETETETETEKETETETETETELNGDLVEVEKKMRCMSVLMWVVSMVCGALQREREQERERRSAHINLWQA